MRSLIPHYVYLAKADGLVKIGTSVYPAERARNLRATLIHAAPGYLNEERSLHKALSSFHVVGEWFHADCLLTPEISAFLGLPDCGGLKGLRTTKDFQQRIEEAATARAMQLAAKEANTAPRQ